MSLEAFKYDFNLISTHSGTIYDRCLVNYSRDESKINYDNSITLYQLVEQFYLLYKEFKDAYDRVEKLKLGKNINFFSYRTSKNYKELKLIIEQPSDIEEDHLYLIIFEREHKLFYVIDNYFNKDKNKQIERHLNIPKETIIDYLYLCDTYKTLLEAFNYLKNKQVFGNGCPSIFTNIEGNIFDNISGFTIHFGNLYFNYEDYIKCPFEFGDDLRINLEESIVKLENETVSNKEEILNDLLHNLYINLDDLPEIFKKEKGKVLKIGDKK